MKSSSGIHKIDMDKNLYNKSSCQSVCVCVCPDVTLFKISTYYPIETKLSMSLDTTLITCLHRPDLVIVQLEQVSGDHFS